jgi:N utilization substance protein B
MNNNNQTEEKAPSRRQFRSLLFHILYATDAFDYEVPPSEIAKNFNLEYETDIDLNGEIVTTVTDIATKRAELDQLFIPFLQNWKFERIGKCTLLILRYAVWELHYSQTPHNIVINEAIELAKCFAEKDSYKFINGMLDRVFEHKQKSNLEADHEAE